MLAGTTASVESPGDPVIRPDAGFQSNTLPANDDDSTAAVPLGFDVDFFGTTYDELYVNNNGNVTFDAPLSAFTPFDLSTTSTVIIAPFFADVDTTGTVVGGGAETAVEGLSPNVVSYGTSTIDGHAAFGVNWNEVGYYDRKTDKLNTFQLVIIDRSDIAPGDFDFEFNYGQIQWETGDVSGGTGGLGGDSARAGYSNGSDENFEIAGSAVNGAFLDSNASTGLIHNSFNSILPGRYRFEVRSGDVPAEIDVQNGGASILDDTGTVDFGTTDVGTPVIETFTVRNTGNADLTVNAATVPAGFSILTNLTNGDVILPGGSRTLAVQLDATTAGTYSGQLSFANTDSDENPFNFAITGEVTTPEISVDLDGDDIPDGSGTVDFGTTTTGAPVQRTITVTNDGTSDLTLSGPINVPAGFSVVSTFGATTLAPGANTTFTLHMDAGVVGTPSGPVDFANTDSDENPFNFTVEGIVNSSSSAPEIQVLDGSTDVPDGTGSVDFGVTAVGAPIARTFTVNNTGTSDLTVQPLSVPAGFSVTSDLAVDQVIPAGGSATFTVQFDAAGPGSASGELSFANTDSDENAFNFAIRASTEAPNPFIIDNGDPGYSTQGEWTPATGGFMRDVDYLPGGGSGSNVALWQFDGLTPGAEYRVSATWRVTTLNASDTSYTILDGVGGPSLGTTTIDQTALPDDFNDAGGRWEDLGIVTIVGSTLVVQLPDAGNGRVMADAVRIERLATSEPEIEVSDGAGPVADGTGNVDFGPTSAGSPIMRTFTVSNTGSSDLTVQPVSVPAGFSVVSDFTPNQVIPAGGSATFTLQFDAAGPGSASGEVSFGNSDADENPFNFTVQGVVAAPNPFIIDNGDPGYDTQGEWTPATGGFMRDVDYLPGGGSGANVASWTFAGLMSGAQYRVSTTWRATTLNATDVQYTVLDGVGGTSLGTTTIDQKVLPDDFNDAGGRWEDLGVVTISGDTLVVQLPDTGNGRVMADAVRIELVPPPE